MRPVTKHWATISINSTLEMGRRDGTSRNSPRGPVKCNRVSMRSMPAPKPPTVTLSSSPEVCERVVHAGTAVKTCTAPCALAAECEACAVAFAIARSETRCGRYASGVDCARLAPTWSASGTPFWGGLNTRQLIRIRRHAFVLEDEAY